MAVVAMRKNFYNLSKIICPSTVILCNDCRGYMKNNRQTLQHLLEISKKRGDDFQEMFVKKNAEFKELTKKRDIELKETCTQLDEKYRELMKIYEMMHIEMDYKQKLKSVSTELSDELGDTKFDLENLTVQYLQLTDSMDGKSVIEIFEQRYVKVQKGQRIAYWNSFIKSNSTVANIVRRKLENLYINVQNINGNFVSNLYHSLPNEVHKSMKSNTELYLLKDNLSYDELIFFYTIAGLVIDTDLITVVIKDKHCITDQILDNDN